MSPRTSPRLLRFVPAAALAIALGIVLVARAQLTRTLNINWDEFHFLAQVHSHLRGEVIGKLLTFHVHLFPWVTSAVDTSNEADQVLAIRAAMFGTALVSCACFAFIAFRLYRSVIAALFAAFVGQSVSYVMNHGASARFDPLVTAGFAVAAALLVARATSPTAVRGSRRDVVVAACAGVAFAFALLVSIKAVLFAPALLAFCFWPLVDVFDGASARRLAVRSSLVTVASFALASVVTFVTLFAAHVSSLAKPGVVDGAAAAAAAAKKKSGLVDLFDRQFPGELLPNPDYLVATVRWDYPFWLLFAAGVALAFIGIGARDDARRTALKVLCCALPLASVIVYRNSFSYFYVCVMPLAALVPALVVARIERRFAARPLVVALLVVALAVPSARQAARWFSYNSDDQVSAQRRTIDAVHAMFPTPTPYVDRCGMIGSHSTVGPFMTSWVLEDYRHGKRAIMPDLLARERPQYLLQNVETLELARAYGGRESRRLLKEDFFALRDSFIPHWGPVWVAGKKLELVADADVPFHIFIPGAYVVETAGDAVAIDGVERRARDVVELATGSHTARASRATPLTLRIASARPPPPIEPPVGRLFSTLGFRTSRP